LEEVEGGAEAGLDVAGEEPRPAVDDTAEIRAVDASLTEEEGEDRDEGRDLGGEDLGAHCDHTADVGGS